MAAAAVSEPSAKTRDPFLRSRANTMLGFFCAVVLAIVVWGAANQQSPWLLILLEVIPFGFIAVSLLERSGWSSVRRKRRAERMVAASPAGSVTWFANRFSAYFFIACHTSATALVIAMAATGSSGAVLPVAIACVVVGYFLWRKAINCYTLTVVGQTLTVRFHPLPAWRTRKVVALAGAYGVIAHCYRWRASSACTLSLVGAEPRVNLALGKVGSLEEAELIAPRVAELIARATGEIAKSLVLNDTPDRASPKEHSAHASA